MVNSFYKIVGEPGRGCKIFFSDKRLDRLRVPINKVFSQMDAVDGSYILDLKDLITGKNKKITNSIENIKRKTEDCLHKIMAARYSLSLIENEILSAPSEIEMKNYSEMIANKMCNQAELKNEVLIYETEAFLFQVRTNIDIVIQLLKYVPGHDYLEDKNRKSDNEAFVFDKLEKDTTYKMRENSYFEMADFFNKEVNDWIRELNKMRNEIAHRSGLNGFTNFVFDSGMEEVIHPKMPNGKDVEKYCSDIFDRLLTFYGKIFSDFVLPKISNNWTN